MSAATPDFPEDDGDDIYAAEYVLGALPGPQQAAAARLAETDAGFAARVAAWEERLFPLAEGYAPAALPAAIKAALDRRLFGAPAALSWWQRLGLWRATTGLATAALVLALALPVLRPPPAPVPAPRLAAALAADASEVRYLALYDAAEGRVGLSRISGEPAAGQDFQLWVIRGSDAPVSLGVIPAETEAYLPVSPDTAARLAAGALLAISVEPDGGSPTGQPTGAVVAAGDLRGL